MSEYRFGLAANILSSHIKSRNFTDDKFRSVLKYLKENVNDISDESKIDFGFPEFTEDSEDEYYGCVMTPLTLMRHIWAARII